MPHGINLFIFRKLLAKKEIGEQRSGECGMGNGEWRQETFNAERRTSNGGGTLAGDTEATEDTEQKGTRHGGQATEH
jgi:hypothetical protein